MTLNIDETLLHGAAKLGNIQLIKSLVERGVNINAQNDNGDTALHIAAKNNQLEVSAILMNPHTASIQNRNGVTALHLLPD